MKSNFEGSAKDVKEDKILAKKHKMSMKDWEKSEADEEHDEQKNMKGLKKGGACKGMKKGGVTSSAMKKYGRNVARAMNQKTSSRGR